MSPTLHNATGEAMSVCTHSGQPSMTSSRDRKKSAKHTAAPAKPRIEETISQAGML